MHALTSQRKHTLTAAVSPLPSLVVVTSRPPAIMVILPLANSMDGAWRASLVTSTSAATRQRAEAPAPLASFSDRGQHADNAQVHGRTEVPVFVTGGAAPSVPRAAVFTCSKHALGLHSFRFVNVALRVSLSRLKPPAAGVGAMARGGEEYEQYDSWPPPRDYAMEKIQAFLAILPVRILAPAGGRRERSTCRLTCCPRASLCRCASWA